MPLNLQQQRAISHLKALKELEEVEYNENKRKTPTCWVNPFLIKRELFDIEANLLKELNWGDGADYKNFMRMTTDEFHEILTLVEPAIKKQNTQMRYAVSSSIRLAITLRFVASGDSLRSLEFLSRVSRKTISKFIPEVLQAIFQALQPTHLNVPRTEDEWLKISDDFNFIWNFPHTLGSIDGKHIRIKKPPLSGSDFFNYKHFFSIILLAVVDAHCKFTYINVGANGRAADSSIFMDSSFYTGLASGALNIPFPKQLIGQSHKTPFFLVADDAFGMGRNVMKPFNRNLNYRLSRTRMTIEMAFGRLANRFRIFHRPIELKEETIDVLIKTCCVLHNFLTKTKTSPSLDIDPDDMPPIIFDPIPYQYVNDYKLSCITREKLALYCITDGDVPFQWKKINVKN